MVFKNQEVLDIRNLYVKSVVLYIHKNSHSRFQPVQHVYITRNSETIDINISKSPNKTSALNGNYVAQRLHQNVQRRQSACFNRLVTQQLFSIESYAFDFLWSVLQMLTILLDIPNYCSLKMYNINFIIYCLLLYLSCMYLWYERMCV